MGFARLAEQSIRSLRGKSETEKLGAMDKILASSIGGALATWNQPIEGMSYDRAIQPLTLHFSCPCRNAVCHQVA